jgi:hypothetical protein
MKFRFFYRLVGWHTQEREMSLLDLMDSLPRTDGIEFDATHAEIELKIPEFD